MIASGPGTYSGQLKLDDDGYGFWHWDPSHDSQTSLKVNGASLNADINSYVVVPNYLWRQGVQLGSRADVSVNLYDSVTGVYRQTEAISSIVGDVGPDSKGVGEISIKAAQQLGFGIQDVSGVGPVPTWRGADCAAWITVTYY